MNHLSITQAREAMKEIPTFAVIKIDRDGHCTIAIECERYSDYYYAAMKLARGLPQIHYVGTDGWKTQNEK